MLTIHIVTIFPNTLTSPFADSIIKRAKEQKAVEIKIYDLRNYTDDKRKTVDDKPFGGGPGMIMKVEPFYKAVKEIKKNSKGKIKVILMSAKGNKFNQAKAHIYSKLNHLVILCGHYEGVDERVKEKISDEEISIGDYILTGGEIPAMVITDSVIRLLPGVLGNPDSLLDESFSTNLNIEYPQYTRPEIFTTDKGEKWAVPEILTSGNHEVIQNWKQEKSN